jgi:hypothetical protein
VMRFSFGHASAVQHAIAVCLTQHTPCAVPPAGSGYQPVYRISSGRLRANCTACQAEYMNVAQNVRGDCCTCALTSTYVCD